jgi:nicotinamidase-related amidase
VKAFMNTMSLVGVALVTFCVVLPPGGARLASTQGGAKGTAMGPDTALLVIDIQNFYFEQGLVPLTGSVEAAQRASRVLDAFRAKRLTIVHVRHVPTSVAIVEGEPADPQYRIRPVVVPVAGEKIISKRHANSFRDTDLLDYLREKGIKKLVIVGMQTHMCVEAASRAATDLGFDVTVVHDACATRPLEFGGQHVPAAQVHATALAAINGSYGRVISVEQLLKELQSPMP